MKNFLFILLVFIVFTVKATTPDWALYGVSGTDFHEGFTPSYSTKVQLHGYVNGNGKLVIPYSFKSAGDLCRGTAIVTDQNHKEGIIDTKGNYTLKPGDYDIYMILMKCLGGIRL